MASELLNRLRGGFDSWNRGDDQEVLQLLREDIIWRTGGLMPDIDPLYEGHEGVQRFWRDFSEPWETISIELEEILDEREHQLLIVARFKARGREGIEVDAPFYQLYRYDEDDLVSEFHAFVDEADARRAAGLSDD